MEFRIMGKSAVKFLIIFVAGLLTGYFLLALEQIHDEFNSIFKSVEIPKDTGIEVKLDSEVSVVCKIAPYDRIVHAENPDVAAKLHEYLYLHRFTRNGEYQQTLLFADAEMKFIHGITVPYYSSGIVVTDDARRRSDKMDKTCISFSKPVKSVYLARSVP